jgi:nucleoside-diphosphate-sugar epimerase
MAMSKVLVTSWPGFFGSVAILRILAAGREVRTMEESPTTGGAEESAMVNAGDIQPSPGASFIAADRDQDVERLDTVAGSEFVDDRIRLRE